MNRKQMITEITAIAGPGRWDALDNDELAETLENARAYKKNRADGTAKEVVSGVVRMDAADRSTARVEVVVKHVAGGRQDDADEEEDDAMPTRQQIIDRIRRVDGTDESNRSDAWLEAFYAAACKSSGTRGAEYRRLDALGDPVDPDDHDHRSQRGANAAVADPGELPDVASMDLRAVKGVALSIGSYSAEIRGGLAADVLERLRELGAGQVADMFDRAWSYGDLDAPSDAEANQAGAAHSDEDDQAAGRRKSAAMARAALEAPGRADERRATMPATRRRSR